MAILYGMADSERNLLNKLQELNRLLKDFDSENGRENLLQFIDELKV